MTNVYTPIDRKVIHFGSPAGEQYGAHEEQVVSDFVARHPEFEIAGREE